MSETSLHVLLAFALAGLAFSSAPNPARATAIAVNSTDDVVANDGQCTLREAVIAANIDAASGAAAGECSAGSEADMILLPAGVYTLTKEGIGEDSSANGDLDIRSDLTIKGAGSGSTIVQAGTDTASGIDRVFDIRAESITVTFDGLTIQHGHLSGSGGGVHIFFTFDNVTINLKNSVITDNQVSDAGGGLAAFNGTVNVSNSTIKNNTAGFGGGISNGWTTFGGNGTLNIFQSSITGNQAISILEGNGGGVFSFGAMNIANSTISGNSAFVGGGGVYTKGGELNLTNLTVIDNTADVDFDGDDDEPGDGGGISQEGDGKTNLKSSLVAENIDLGTETPDIAGVIASDGYNLIGDVGMTNFNSNTTGDRYGDPNGTTTPSTGAMESGSAIDPLVGALTGSPAYHPLNAGSPAIDQIPPWNCKFLSSGTNPLFSAGSAVTSDQIATPRPADGFCEIGAIEIPGEVTPSVNIFLPLLVE